MIHFRILPEVLEDGLYRVGVADRLVVDHGAGDRALTAGLRMLESELHADFSDVGIGGGYHPQVDLREVHEPALHKITSQISANRELRLGLHAFCDHTHTQQVREATDTGQEDLLTFRIEDSLDEVFVYLHKLDGAVVHQLQIGMA